MSAATATTLATQWSQEFVRVMDAMADTRPEMQTVEASGLEIGHALWWQQTFDAAPRAAIWLGTPAAAWQALGRQILTAAGVESSSEDEIRSSYLEVLRQSLSALANALGAQLEREVTCTEGTEQAPPGTQGAVCRVSLRLGEEVLPELQFRASAALLEALFKPQKVEDAPPLTESQDTVDVSARVFNTLDLLLDVEMPVSVSFGRTQVRIQDVLKLITGSIIELDRSIAEPVEVIVNNCVIARGEVVVVEGNYGVRINEVMSRQQRLQESRRYLLPVHHR